MKLLLDRVPSPIGTILLVSDGEALRALDFEDHEERMLRLLERHYGVCEVAAGADQCGFRARIAAYFEGDLGALDEIPVRTGGSAFERRVWARLREIAPGATTTYGRIAVEIGAPRASRAVGRANGANPVAIVVPCHRVIGANASLTGYGGGLERKAWLLRHEEAFSRGSMHGADRRTVRA